MTMNGHQRPARPAPMTIMGPNDASLVIWPLDEFFIYLSLFLSIIINDYSIRRCNIHNTDIEKMEGSFFSYIIFLILNDMDRY